MSDLFVPDGIQQVGITETGMAVGLVYDPEMRALVICDLNAFQGEIDTESDKNVACVFPLEMLAEMGITADALLQAQVEDSLLDDDDDDEDDEDILRDITDRFNGS